MNPPIAELLARGREGQERYDDGELVGIDHPDPAEAGPIPSDRVMAGSAILATVPSSTAMPMPSAIASTAWDR